MKKDIFHLRPTEGLGVDGATLGLGFILAFGAFYIFKKFKKWLIYRSYFKYIS